MPFLVASMFHRLFLICVMRTLSLSCLDACDLSESFEFFKNSMYFSRLLDLWLSLIHCLIFLLMSLTWALSFLSIFLRLSMRVQSSWPSPWTVSSLRVAFVAARRSSVSVSSFVIASVVVDYFCHIFCWCFFSLPTCSCSVAAAAAASVFIVCR